jgi:hypothetical protein
MNRVFLIFDGDRSRQFYGSRFAGVGLGPPQSRNYRVSPAACRPSDNDMLINQEHLMLGSLELLAYNIIFSTKFVAKITAIIQKFW